MINNVAFPSQIGGNVEFQKGGAVTVNAKTRVAGDIILTEHAGLLVVNDNTITGSVQINNNTGGARINRNTIAGNLQCQDNIVKSATGTVIFTGSQNIVSGNKEDQCLRF